MACPIIIKDALTVHIDLDTISARLNMEKLMQVKSVGVVGAGVMGVGIAQDLAQTGHQVILVDLYDEILDRAQKKIGQKMLILGLMH